MWTPNLEDVISLPRDPDELREHLYGVGALQPPPPPAAPTVVPELTPPTNTAATPALKPFTPPSHPHLPAMKSAELPEAPSMAAAPIMPPESSKLVNPMSAPNLAAPPAPTGAEGGLPFTSGAEGVNPVSTPQAGSIPYYQSELDRATAARRGDTLASHPSFMGKVGHVLGRVGNVALESLMPGVAAMIPGSDLNKRLEERKAQQDLAGEQERESKGKLETAQTAEAEARAKKLGQEGDQDLILDKAGNIRGWHDAKGGLHSLNDPETPQAIKDMAKDWEGTPDKQKRAENIEQMLAGRIQDVYAAGGDPATDKQVQFLEQEKEKLVNQKEGQGKPSEEDKAIDDYLQGHKLANTPTNRDKARSILKTRDRSSADEETKELRKELLRGQVEKSKEPTIDEQRRADLGENMIKNLDELEAIVDRRPDLFGPGAGRLTSIRDWLGTGDKDIARLHTIKEYLGMASVGAHAMKNAQHVETAADAVMNSLKNEPDATKAAIGEARGSVQTFLNDANRRRNAIEESKGGGSAAGKTSGGPPRAPKQGMKWQQNKRTGEYREVPETQ